MTPEPLIIIGTGGGAHDVLDIVEAINARGRVWEVRGFLDDTLPVGSERLGLPVLGWVRDAGRFEACWFISCIGSDRSFRGRPEVVARTGVGPERFATLVHPGAAVSPRARLGRGSYVNFGASIGGGVIVGHDTAVGDFSMLAPGAVVSRFVTVGRGCYVGAGAVIRQQVAVGEGALVGMGAVVTRDVGAGDVVVGCPARPIGQKGKESRTDGAVLGRS